MQDDILILGSGMAGLGAAHRLNSEGRKARVLDKNAYAGGHTTTHIRDGYVFDEGPHVSFTKNERIKKFFAEAINNEYLSIDAYIDNYWRGQYIRHPVITNMHGMPRDVVVKCITDYVEAKQNRQPDDQQLRRLAGGQLRPHVRRDCFRCNTHRSTTPPLPPTSAPNGSARGCTRRSCPRCSIGALSSESPNIHYVQDYRYPKHGGFAAFLTGLADSKPTSRSATRWSRSTRVRAR